MTDLALKANGELVLKDDGSLGFAPECCCGCTPCVNCTAGCLSITFAGFASEAECDECNGLNGTYTLTRGSGVLPTLDASATVGSGAAFTATLTLNADGSYSLTALTVDSGGSGYTEESVFEYTLLGAETRCGSSPAVTLTVDESGAITAAEITSGGKFYPLPTCVYSYCEQTACDGSPCRKISLTADGDGFTVRVTVGSTTLLTATKAPAEGVACDSLEYSPGEVTSETCTTIGSITVEPAECGSGPSPTACCGCETCPELVYLESLDVYAYERDGRYFVINETVSGGWMDDPCGTCDTSTAPWNPPGNPGCSALGGAAWQCYLGRWFAGNTEVSCFRYVAPDTFDCVTGWVGPDSFVIDEWGNLFYGLELATDGLCPSLPVDQTHDILDSYLAPPGGAAGDHVAYCNSIGMPRPTSFSLTVTEVFPFP